MIRGAARSDATVRWLKADFIAGARADGVVGILMLTPERLGNGGLALPWVTELPVACDSTTAPTSTPEATPSRSGRSTSPP